MKVVNPNSTNHTINIISRLYPTDVIVFSLYNESTQETTIVDNTYLIQDGYVYINFDFTFIENDRFTIEVIFEDEIIYRGKLIATAEETQTYLNDNNEFYYE